MKGFVCVAVAALAGAAAQGQTIRFDINNLAFQAQDGSGQASPFGGTGHTGSLVVTSSAGSLVDVGIREGTGLPFIDHGFSGSLTDFQLTIELSGGGVTGGNLLFDVNGGPSGGGDRYSAALGAGGSVEPFVGGGYTIDGLSLAGLFSDAGFSNVDVGRWFDVQGGGLAGSFLFFDFRPDASGAGTGADFEHYVNVPTPGAIACLGLAGIVALRRRR